MSFLSKSLLAAHGSALAFLLSACATQQSKHTLLLQNSWEIDVKDVNAVLPGQQMSFKADYEAYLVFGANTLKKDTVCHFREPFQKTLIVSTTAPIEYKGNRAVIKTPTFERQEFKAVLKRKDGTGKERLASAFCESRIDARDYEYKILREQLILKSVEETLRLKKYRYY